MKYTGEADFQSGSGSDPGQGGGAPRSLPALSDADVERIARRTAKLVVRKLLGMAFASMLLLALLAGGLAWTAASYGPQVREWVQEVVEAGAKAAQRAAGASTALR